jgi:hypothetical protein
MLLNIGYTIIIKIVPDFAIDKKRGLSPYFYIEIPE